MHGSISASSTMDRAMTNQMLLLITAELLTSLNLHVHCSILLLLRWRAWARAWRSERFLLESSATLYPSFNDGLQSGFVVSSSDAGLPK